MQKTILIVAATLVILTGCGDSQPQQQSQQMPPPEVDVVQPLTKEIALWDEFTGRFIPLKSVELRSRVSGFLVEQRFKDGDIVEQGQVLFVVDPRPFQFEVDRTDAQYKLAQNEFNRADGLLRTRAISKEDFERRQQELVVAEANLATAKLNLEFTQITAPFTGRVSDGFIDLGNLVQANQDVLSTIVSLDPIHFEMEASQGELLKYTRLDIAGKRGTSRTNPTATFVKLQDETKFVHAGVIDFVDNVVDQDTGTIRARALIDNSDLIITPGLFGRARIAGSGVQEWMLLPEKVINTDQDRKFVYVVDDNNQAQRKYVSVGELLDNRFIIINEGLEKTDRVVLSGVQRIRATGQPVSPVEQQLEWVPIESMPVEAAENMIQLSQELEAGSANSTNVAEAN